ncbi:uncharacterized protein Pyn_24506 [Prunus yedoensis var. nudiflora]|uniref:Uncharacterized protein n=1 Tax=Prunus yedoensis var. nudiflora TaxID=2094558 RepID=A0A314USW9_PRUYE|nr:uncharacterized protein Pyn_24506 [Prunus yedoensis var. nudiflora]
MASATVVDHHNPDPNPNPNPSPSPSPNPNHLHLDSLPLIDLRLLSQSDLYSLSLTSSSSLSNPTRRFDDDVLIPKIDRSVFNESAGSRKQTYSRLRLAPRNSQFPIANPKSQPAPFSHSQSNPRPRNPPDYLSLETTLPLLRESRKRRRTRICPRPPRTRRRHSRTLRAKRPRRPQRRCWYEAEARTST